MNRRTWLQVLATLVGLSRFFPNRGGILLARNPGVPISGFTTNYTLEFAAPPDFPLGANIFTLAKIAPGPGTDDFLNLCRQHSFEAILLQPSTGLAWRLKSLRLFSRHTGLSGRPIADFSYGRRTRVPLELVYDSRPADVFERVLPGVSLLEGRPRLSDITLVPSPVPAV